MMKVKGIFAVSLIAIMVVGGAYADIASSGYVDEKIDGLATVAKSGAYSDLSGRPNIPTVNNATLTIQKNGATVDTFTANASANKTINITVPTTTSQLTNNSGFITSADLPEDYVLPAATANALGGVKSGGDITVATSGAVTVNSATKADSATTAASATKATQDASGNVITSTYATKTELNAKQNASTAVEVATAGTAVGDSTHPVYVNASGVATKIDKVAAAAKADTATSATNATNATNDADGNEITETYATKSELTSGLSGKQATLSSAQLNAVNSGITSTKVSTYDGYSAKITAAQSAADAAADAAAAAQSTASGKLSSISGSTGGTGNVVTSVSASGSTVSATKGITAEETKNKVTSVRAAASATDTAYPSEKAVATALAAKANTSALSGYATTSALGAVEDKAEAAQSAASAAQSTANAKVTTAQGSGNANKAVITNASGNITTGKIASGMIADGAVSSAKIGTGAVGNGNLANNAVTSAKIADGTITNADISDDAAIDAAKIDGLATVATSGSYNDLANKPSIPTVNNAKLTIQKNGTNVATFTANSASAATANITVPTKTSELTNDSNFATTTQVNARVATAQGTDNANDVMVVNASGNVAPALITNANISSSAAIAQSKISGLTDALAGKLSTGGTAARATADASGNNIVNTYATKSQITALDSTSTGTGAVVTAVSQKDGKVSVTKGNVKIPVGGENATSYATIWIE